MKQWSPDKLMKGLQEFVPEIDLKKYDDGSIWVGAEDACFFKEIPAFNHNLEYGEMLVSEATHITIPNDIGMKVKELYIYGIHGEIYSWLEARGWYPQWQDPGTLLLWKCDKYSDETIIENLEEFQDYHDFRENDGIEAEVLKRLNKKMQGDKLR